MVGPAAGGVGADEIAQLLTRLDVDRVLVGPERTMPVLELAPQPVQMDIGCSIIVSLISTKRTRSPR